jgi:hypothetical protein
VKQIAMAHAVAEAADETVDIVVAVPTGADVLNTLNQSELW